MGKGDKKRAQRMIDNQGQRSQDYLSGVQNQLGNMNWNTGNQMWGSDGMLQPGQAVDRGGFTGPYQPPGAGGRTNPNGAAPAGGATGGQDPEAQFRGIMGNSTGTVQNLLAKRSELEAAGYQLIPNATKGADGQPTNYDIRLPNGEVVDVIKDASHGGGHPWQWGMGEAQTEYGRQHGGSAGGAGRMGADGVAGMNLNDYGNIMGRYEGFADTGGYSEQDKANIRQRAVSPIRAMFERGTQDLDRQKAIQGGYAPGHATALTRMNRNMGQGMSDATGNAEANISQMVHAGKLAGMGGMAGMYGATPGLSNMFGNQQLQAQGNMLTGAGLQNQLGNSLMQNQIHQGGMEGFPWAKVMKGIGTGAMIAAGSSRKIKHDIKEVSSKDVVNRLKKLKLYEWKYRGEDTKHVGPIAEEFKKTMGVGDGKTLHLADVMGASLAVSKELAEKGER